MQWKKEGKGVAWSKWWTSDFCFESRGDNSEGKEWWKQLASWGERTLLQWDLDLDKCFSCLKECGGPYPWGLKQKEFVELKRKLDVTL